MDDKENRRPGPSNGKEASSEIIGSNSEIGRRLRQLYDEVLSEDVPDRFAQLLSQLDKVDTPRDSK